MAVPFWDPVPDVAEGPTYVTEEWDTVKLAGEQLPGIARAKITSGGDIRVDIQSASGRDGGVLVKRGYVPAQIEIEVKTWTDAQWADLQEIADMLIRKPGKLDAIAENKRKNKEILKATNEAIQEATESAISIYAPSLAPAKVENVIIRHVSPAEPGPEKGTMIVKIRAVEYIPPPPETKKATRKVEGVAPPSRVKEYRDPTPARNKPAKPSATDTGPRIPVSPNQGSF